MKIQRWLWASCGLMIMILSARLTMAQTERQYPEPPYRLTEETIAHIREIYAVGQRYGNRPGVFSKIGDSITVSPYFLAPIGYGDYDLGDFAYLQPVVDHFTAIPARESNSFLNRSLSAVVGWAAWSALDPGEADPDACAPNEPPLMCEYRIVRPSVALIMFGTNDVGYRTPAQFRDDMTRIVQISAAMGVIPIISTIPNRPNMPYEVAEFNHILTETAAVHHVPLWDFYSVSVPLPNFGLAWDGVHPSHPPDDFVTTADFRSIHLAYGYTLRNLTALEMLYTVWWHLGLG